jgi:hypothetical protein|tara:strand:- start:48 stop:377 length:330 start_codon:yes stop_codon:yes gene_type:complete
MRYAFDATQLCNISNGGFLAWLVHSFLSEPIKVRTIKEPTMQDLLDALTTFVNNLVEERVDAVLEVRLVGIVEQAVADVPTFDISDHYGEIEDIVTDTIKEVSFTVTVD